MKIDIARKEVIHFIGIGGIGMSGLAQIMKNIGFTIQGSDLNYNKNVAYCRLCDIRVVLRRHRIFLRGRERPMIVGSFRQSRRGKKGGLILAYIKG